MKTLNYLSLALALSLVTSCANTPSKDTNSKSSSTTVVNSGSGSGAGANAKAGPAAPTKVSESAAAKAPAKDEMPMATGAAVYYPTGTRQNAALSIEKMTPDEVAVGKPFDYMIKVTNVSGTAMEDVIVREQIDADFSMSGSEPKGTPGADRTIAFDLGTIPAGQSKMVKLTGSASKPGSLTSCATLDYKIPMCASIKVSAPGLALTKTMGPSDVTPCDTITGKLVVSNPGTGITRGVKVKDPLPEGLTTADGKNMIEVDVGQLKAGESREIPFTLKATKTGKFTNTAMATADGNLKADSQAVTVNVHQPVLSVKAECPTGPLMIGRQGTYKFTVKNTGDAPAANTVLTVAIPNSMTFVSADNGGAKQGTDRCVWNVGTLGVNETKVFSAVYKNTGAGVITARAQVTANCATEVRDACETTVKGVPDIGVLLTDNVGVTTVGDPQEYMCEVKNQGQTDLTNVKVVATWPGELDWVSSGFNPAPAAAANKAEFMVGTLKIGETRKFSFTLKAKTPGEFKINTLTTCTEIKNALSQDEVTNFIER